MQTAEVAVRDSSAAQQVACAANATGALKHCTRSTAATAALFAIRSACIVAGDRRRRVAALACQFILDDRAVLHHEADVLQGADVCEWIAVDCYRVGVHARGRMSEIGRPPEQFGGGMAAAERIARAGVSPNLTM